MEKEPIFEQKELKPRERIIKAIKSGDSENLFSVLEETDKALTDNLSNGSFTPSVIGELKEKIKEFLKDVKEGGNADLEIYLGDGGFSRLYLTVDYEGIEVELGGQSTKKVKEKWEEINL